MLDERLAGAGEPVGDPAAGPERAAVVAAAVGVGPFLTLTVPLGVNQARVQRAQILIGDGEALTGVGEEIGEEDVGGLDQAIENLAAGRLVEVATLTKLSHD